MICKALNRFQFSVAGEVEGFQLLQLLQLVDATQVAFIAVQIFQVFAFLNPLK